MDYYRYPIETLNIDIPEVEKFSCYSAIPPVSIVQSIPILYMQYLVFYDHPKDYTEYFINLIETLLSEREMSNLRRFKNKVRDIILHRDINQLDTCLQRDDFVQPFKIFGMKLKLQYENNYNGHIIYEVLSKGLKFNSQVFDPQNPDTFHTYDFCPDAPEMVILEAQNYFVFFFPTYNEYGNAWKIQQMDEISFIAGMFPDLSPEIIRRADSIESLHLMSEKRFASSPEPVNIDTALEQSIVLPRNVPKRMKYETFLEELKHEIDLDDETYQMLKKRNKDENKSFVYLSNMATQMWRTGNSQAAVNFRKMAQQAKIASDESYDIIHLQTFKRRNPNLLNSNFLDLHGLRLAEAMRVVKEFVLDLARGTYSEIKIITGRGLHSVDGIPVIKNKTQQFLIEYNLKFKELVGGFIVTY